MNSILEFVPSFKDKIFALDLNDGIFCEPHVIHFHAIEHIFMEYFGICADFKPTEKIISSVTMTNRNSFDTFF